MVRFLFTRAFLLFGGWVLMSVFIFSAVHLLPGDVAQVIAGVTASPEEVLEIRRKLGLDTPLITQYSNWILGFLHGDMGVSLLSKTPVSSEIVAKMQITLPLAILGMLFAVLFALPAGVYAAYHSSRKPSRVADILSSVAAAVPTLWLGLGIITVFAIYLHWFPAGGFPRTGWEEPVSAMRALILPAFTIGLVDGAILVRFVKSATVSALQADYVRSAMSYGYTRFSALIRFGLPGVGLSLISVLGLQFAGLLAGTIVIEQLFSLPGIGQMTIADIGARDLIKVQSTLLLLTGMILTVGVVLDTLHRLIDPRLRQGAQER